MAPVFTMNATALLRPRCIAWMSCTPQEPVRDLLPKTPRFGVQNDRHSRRRFHMEHAFEPIVQIDSALGDVRRYRCSVAGAPLRLSQLPAH